MDLPGYGFAKVSKDQRGAWTTLVRAYLNAGDRSLALFHLLDARHEPSAEDAEMSFWLREAGVPFAIAVTKVDKIGSTKLAAHLRRIITALELPPGTPFIPTSATRGEGRGEMAAWIEARLAIAATDG